MTHTIDFDQYWGVRVSDIRFDCKAMSIVLDMYWTVNSIAHRARLRFDNVSKFEFSSEKVFDSEVVELISLTGKKVSGRWCVVGEMSNYEFVIICASIADN
jgi:hypothetical protein